jgi:hypothetical protein
VEDLTAGRRGEGIRDHGLPLLMAGAGFGGKDFFNFYLLIGGERKDTGGLLLYLFGSQESEETERKLDELSVFNVIYHVLLMWGLYYYYFFLTRPNSIYQVFWAIIG